MIEYSCPHNHNNSLIFCVSSIMSLFFQVRLCNDVIHVISDSLERNKNLINWTMSDSFRCILSTDHKSYSCLLRIACQDIIDKIWLSPLNNKTIHLIFVKSHVLLSFIQISFCNYTFRKTRKITILRYDGLSFADLFFQRNKMKIKPQSVSRRVLVSCAVSNKKNNLQLAAH